MKNHRKRPSWQTIILIASVLAIAPKRSFSQGFDARISEEEMQRRRNNQATHSLSAERAYEERYKKESRTATTEGEQKRIIELQKNFPPNRVTPEMVYWFYFKNKGSAFVEKLNEKSPLLRSYLSFIKKVQLERYDEFDRRKLVNAAIEEIKKGVSEIDYNTVYTCPISLTGMDEYNFKSHNFRLHTQANTALMAAMPDFKFIGLNLFGTENVIFIDMDEAAAEKVVKSMRGKDISRNMTAVYYFRLNPKLYTAKSGLQHLTATVFRVDIDYVEWHNNEAYFGDKIGEREFGTDPWVHPELN